MTTRRVRRRAARADERALALPQFRRFLLARAISWSGNSVTLVAMPILIFQLTGNAALTGLLTAFEALPYLVFGLPAGALADRWDRRRVMVLTGAGSGVALATVPVAHALGVLTVPQLFIAALTTSTLFVFFDAAGFGALPELVGRARITSATAAMLAFSTVISLVGPATGGALAALAGAAWALAIDAACYLMAALLTARIRWTAPRREDGPAVSRSGLLAEIGEGLRYIWDTKIIRWLTLIGAGASVSGGALLGLTVVVAVRQLGMADDDSRIGLLYSATALGAFLVSLTVSAVQRTVPTGWITLTSLAVSWAAQLAWAITTSIPVGLAILVVFQAASSLTIMNGIIVRQSLAPDVLQSRVNTTARMIAWGGTPLGALLGGFLAERFDTGIALALCSLGTAAGLVLAVAVRLWSVPRLAVLRSTLELTSGDDVTERGSPG